MHGHNLSTPGILKLFWTAAEEKFLCLGIKYWIILWYCDLLTMWENLHCENWKMYFLNHNTLIWNLVLKVKNVAYILKISWKVRQEN